MPSGLRGVAVGVRLALQGEDAAQPADDGGRTQQKEAAALSGQTTARSRGLKIFVEPFTHERLPRVARLTRQSTRSRECCRFVKMTTLSYLVYTQSHDETVAEMISR